MVGNLPWSSTGAFSLPRANLRAYPNYTSPIAAGPALSQLPSQCSVHLFSGVLLTAYGQIATAPFSTPTGACSAPWSSVVLSMHGSVRGVQFDRYGALWIGGVELLRTTTPEPSPAGIDWHIARDVTVYGSFLASGEPMNATLSIPNVVDSTYTGALSISVSLSFEPGRSLDDGLTTEAPADLVIPLANPARSREAGGSSNVTAPTSPWAAMAAGRKRNISGVMSVIGRNAVQARVLLFASAHQCEEFWYTNVPDALVNSSSGTCGGGPYRELEVLVDGVVAGAAYPFPTIYSGGVCPTLWRPLAGIQQFNVPPLTFDLSPLLPLLNDGLLHTITARVLHSGAKGVWYLDPVLLLWLGSEPLAGRLLRASRSPPRLVQTVGRAGARSFRVETRGTSSFDLAAELWPASSSIAVERGQRAPAPGAALVRYSVEGTLRASNANDVDPAGGVTNGKMESTTSNAAFDARGGMRVRHSAARYPYHVEESEEKDAHSFLLSGEVAYSLQRSEEWRSAPAEAATAARETAAAASLVLGWSVDMASRAAYNRSTGPDRKVHWEEGRATAIVAAPAACFSQELEAASGDLTHAAFKDGCPKARGRRALCRHFDACAAPMPGVNVPLGADG